MIDTHPANGEISVWLSKEGGVSCNTWQLWGRKTGWAGLVGKSVADCC